MGKSTLILLIVFSSLSSFGQTFSIAKLDSFFNALEKRDLAMGSLTIAQNGKIQYQRALGYAYIDSIKKIPASINTKYRIGSETKMFTAVIIFQLMEEGKINLDQKLSLYFPDLPNASKITISNLLNHRSGLHNYTEGTNYKEWMDKPTTHEQLLKIIQEKGTDFEPNARAEYSNTNYLLLSYIIEKICNMPYEMAITKRIISKIGLVNTYYGRPIDLKKSESASYKNVENKWQKEKETDLSIHVGAGSIVSTPTDMITFIEALFNNKLVSKSSLKTMKTLVDGYGMGLFPFDHGSQTAFGHNGRIEEFYSSVRYFPDAKLSVAYITNGIIYPRIDIIDVVLKICFNEPFIAPFSKPITLKSEDLDKYVGKYSSDQMPIIINCTKDANKLLLETRGKMFEVEPINNNYFMHAATGYFFEFFPDKEELQIKDTDNIYYLKRSK
ncbi:beta-lactamase family protein [Chitinophagaceae bacterium LB-8]|uniref:Beta-lactamase family protein n=1 Tax=Paraflavisolibacter caeni TaxID=2982496 RepID=A0A9X3BI26_9BACT|nr:serine hydrolase [Paraflavisolibacter caeni]MCU7549578.1 beta-lactamase family protein [Paraflavisolibacter caeni]